jgi:hypothetical protein
VPQTYDPGHELMPTDLQGAGGRSSSLATTPTSADLRSGVVAAACLDVVCSLFWTVAAGMWGRPEVGGDRIEMHKP